MKKNNNHHRSSSLYARTALLFFCLSANQLTTLVHADLITETCMKSYLHTLCTSVLRSDPRSSSAKDVKDLARILVQKCIENATDTLEVIHKLQASDPKLEKLLSNCESDYQVAIKDDFGGAMKNLEANNYKKAAKLAYVGGARGPVDCEGTYADKKGSPIRKRNSDIAYLGLLAQSIILFIPE